jgi:SPP1 gp7 family putative phage head morphogenesis protein
MIDFPNDPRGRELLLLIERAKYERWVSRALAQLLEREFNRVVDLLVSGKYRDLTQFQQLRIHQLFQELDARIRAGYVDAGQLQLREMHGYAELEASLARRFALDAVGASVIGLRLGPALPRVFLEAIARLPIQGLSIGEWFSAQAQTMSRETRRVIQQGLVEGKSPLVISRRILADARTEGPVLVRRAINEARIIARTTVNAVQNAATMASNEALPRSISDSYRLVAVHDRRTSAICRALDGNIYRYDDPQRRVPPFHVNCRTTTFPILKGAELSVGDQKNTPLSFKAYGDWLQTQSIAVQNEILGPTRAAWWRDGTMTLADAIDLDNRVLALEQLRARFGIAAARHVGAL